MTTLLQKISLQAYRGISGVVLDQLTPVSLIVGASNAGKSSILEAAGLMLRPPDPGQWVSAVRRRDSDVSLVDGIWSMFPRAEAPHPDDGIQESELIVLDAVLWAVPRHVEARAFVLQVPGAFEGADLAVRVDVSVNGKPAVEMRFATSRPVVHDVPVYRVLTVTPSSHYSTSVFVEQLSQVVDAGRKQLAIMLLQIFDPAVEDLDVVVSGDRRAVRVTHAERGVVDLSSFGDGMRRAAVLALALTRAYQGVLLIDEIEAGIHRSVLRPVLEKLIEAAAASQVQIIATTHSLEAVDTIIGAVEARQTPESLSAFWLQRSGGKHEVRRYDFAKLCTLRDGGLDIR